MNQENNDSKICPICGRATHKESIYCIFHADAEEKTEEEFKEALKEYVNKIKEKNRDHDFEKFIFIGDINFKEDLDIAVFEKANFESATFEGEADFRGATFEGEADFRGATFGIATWFRGATFRGDVDFAFATFEGDSLFESANFRGDVDFTGATFERDSYFASANFEGDPSFWETTFEQYAGFVSANFEGVAAFASANFEGGADFRGTTFKGYADFEIATFKGNVNFGIIHTKEYISATTFEQYAGFVGATFKGDVNFSIKAIKKNIRFANALFTQGKTLVIETTDVKNEVVINFKKVCLENVYLELFLGEKTLIDFTNALLRNTRTKKKQIENHILQEKRKEFSQAREIYLLLKNNFHSIGRYYDEGWAFKKEKDMERKSNSHFKTLHKWLWSCFLNGLFGYGEQPVKVIISAIIIILIFTFLFMSSGISNSIIGGSTSKYFLDCAYFSVITFTTLGYGDFRPLEGWGRIFAGTEAFIGALMMALFVYTFARRTGGR